MPQQRLLARALTIAACLILVSLYQNCGSGFETADISQMSPADIAEASTAPSLSFSNTPPLLSAQRSATFSFTTETNRFAQLDELTCALDGAPPVDCRNGFSTVSLADGDHQLVARATDSRGNVAPAITHAWRVDGTSPTITITSMPSNQSSATTARFEFTALDNLAGIETLECRMNSSPFTPCVSPAIYSGLSIGSNTFQIRANDRAGNAQMAAYGWTITATTPTPTPNPTPTPVMNFAELTWDPNTEANLAGYRVCYGTVAGTYPNCVDARLPAIINGRVTYTITSGLQSGIRYYFVVRAYDTSGNQSAFSNEGTKAF